MSGDRELLELAAKSAGLCYIWRPFGGFIDSNNGPIPWDPLANDGDSLRLAVKLQLNICNEHVKSGVAYCMSGVLDDHKFMDVVGSENCESEILPEDYAATRRAIVRAAAEIGRRMP